MIELAKDVKLPIGTVIQDRYRIVSQIGKGGTGEVYQVEHTLVGRNYALKVLHEALAKSPPVIARFHREARAAAAIGNAHIVEVIDMGYLEKGHPFLVMELLEGRDLYTELSEEGPLSIGRAVGLTNQCCQALEAAHEKGIVHRDMKPENIFLTERDDGSDFIKILDFGVSKVLEAAGEPKTGKLTWSGAPMGTPQYMSIEQLNNCSDIDSRTDVYATGVVLFEMLTGHLPFEARTFSELVTKIANEPPPSLGKWRPDIPPELEQAIHRSLAKDRQERFASMEELAEALVPFSDNTSRAIVPTEISSVSTLPGVVSQPPDAIDQNPQEEIGMTADTLDRVERNTNGRSTLPGVGSQPPDAIDQNFQEDSVITTEIPNSHLSRTKLPKAQALIGAIAVGVTVLVALAYGSSSGSDEATKKHTSSRTESTNADPLRATGDRRVTGAFSSARDSVSKKTSVPSTDTSGVSTESRPNVVRKHPRTASSNAAHDGRRTELRSSALNADRTPAYKRNSGSKPTAKSVDRSLGSRVSTRHRPKRKANRRVTLHNAVRATVNVIFKCKSVSTTVRVSPRGKAIASIPLESCRVRCRGMGGPVCPSSLDADAILLEIR